MSRQTREEYFKKKAEDEARRNGTLPAEKDSQGRVINPHIPEYMKVAPWYMGGEAAGLDHQRLPESSKYSSDINAGWYERGSKAATNNLSSSGKVSSSGRATCTNCGSSSHIAKNCLEKPRKSNAIKAGVSVGSTDLVQPALSLSYDGKRDTYNGLDTDAQMRALKKQNQILLVKNADAGKRRVDDKDGGSGGGKASLRVRGDTAKYLINLDPESAFYDPKTRSMRDNPNPSIPLEQATFAGDNFVRNSGEASDLDRVEAFASLRSAQTSDASQSLQANPTAVALAKREFEERKEKLAAERKRQMEEQYGASATKQSSVPVQASSAYVEYAPDGTVVEGSISVPVAMSRFEEDVYERNHSQVWGSYFNQGMMTWGYACCWQSIRNSFCTGEDGKRAMQESLARAQPNAMTLNQNKEGTQARDVGQSLPPSMSASTMYGEVTVDAQFDKSKLAEAIKRVKESKEDDSLSSSSSSSSSQGRRKKRRESLNSSPSEFSSTDDDDDFRSSSKRKLSKHRSDSKRSKKKSKKSKSERGKKSKKHKRSYEEARGSAAGKNASVDAFGRDINEPTPEDLEAQRLLRIREGDPMVGLSGDRLLS